jgi:prophage antirepressor-like protein
MEKLKKTKDQKPIKKQPIKTEDNLITYNVIPEAKNILLTLVENVTNDDIFQKHLNILESNPESEKKASIIKNTINNIRVFNTSINPLFLANDIGILLGISHINYFIRQFEPEEKSIGYITLPNSKIKKVLFLTRLGIYRCFYASRSPLAKLFRKFIGSLIDHIIIHEKEVLQKVSTTFKAENSVLIEQGMNDLESKLIEYQNKYIEEQKRADELEIELDDEHKKRKDAEADVTEIDIINNYNMMQIEQLKKEKDMCINRIKSIKNTVSNDNDSIDLIEIKLLKEMFMKQIYINILYPAYFLKLLKSLQKNDDNLKNQSKHDELNVDMNSDEDTPQPNTKKISMEKIKELENDMAVYKRNFDNIYFDKNKLSNNSANIEKDEILYYHISFARNSSKKDKLMYVSSQHVLNKIHYNKLITSLAENCETLEINKLVLFKTSLEEIADIIREEFINLKE